MTSLHISSEAVSFKKLSDMSGVASGGAPALRTAMRCCSARTSRWRRSRALRTTARVTGPSPEPEPPGETRDSEGWGWGYCGYIVMAFLMYFDVFCYGETGETMWKSGTETSGLQAG